METRRSEYRQAVLDFWEEQKLFKESQTRFGEIKNKFYGTMSECYEYNNIEDGKFHIDGGIDTPNLIVTRIQNTKLKFDPDKLEKVLGKELSEDVIIKHYTVTDMYGLVSYLKQCTQGVDPKIFRSFIAVSKTVDTKALDQLEALGKISLDQIKGCYTIERQSPYFTVNVERGQSDGKRE